MTDTRPQHASRLAKHPPVTKTPVVDLELKPDLADAARRWDAFFAGEMLDRPIVCVTAPREGAEPAPAAATYRDCVFMDIDEVVNKQLRNAEATFFGGEAIPGVGFSCGPDETAVWCDAELGWSEDSGNTNWSLPCIDDWAEAPPIAVREDNYLYQRMRALHGRAAELVAGKTTIAMIDLHTNMDLVAAMRGPQRLCTDLLDAPEAIDRAMMQARAAFPVIWDAVWEAGCISEVGYAPSTTLQCDFSCMMSPAMFRRWVLPALEEEAEIVGNVVYHWDGPGALAHTEDLIASKGLHTLSYVPGDGHGGHTGFIDLFKHVQAGGKAVQVWGSPDEVKLIHRELRPDKVQYHTWAGTQAEAEQLLAWFVANT
jgi:hypothetical protein